MERLKWFYVGRVLALLPFVFINIPASYSLRVFNPRPNGSPFTLTTANENVINVGAMIRTDLRRRISDGDSSFSERLKHAVVRSKSRSQKIDAIVNKAVTKSMARVDPETPLHLGDGEYLIELAVGSPSVSFDAIVDTGSDLIWTQCKPCQDCYNQTTPIFDPSESSTYSTVPCNDSLCRALGFQQGGCNPDCSFNYQYTDGSFTKGVLSYETLSIGNGTKAGGIGFGCGHDNQGQTLAQGGGVVGLGRGPLSLISQLGTKVDNKFSYCLLPISDSSSKTSPLFFGDSASFSGAKSITLIKNALIPTFWYIPLTGITLNGSALDIIPATFDLKPDGSGGIIIDSGTTVTFLDEAAYIPLKKAVQLAVDLTPADGSATGLDLCYKMQSGSGQLNLPSFAFNFKGGVDYEILPENYFVQIDDLLCLAFLGSSGGTSILGNIQQQNVHILYDNSHNTLSFKPTDCNSL